jgi:hypothetical protein
MPILSNRFHSRELLHHGKWNAYLVAGLDQNTRYQSRMFALHGASEPGERIVGDLSGHRTVEESEATASR